MSKTPDDDKNLLDEEKLAAAEEGKKEEQRESDTSLQNLCSEKMPACAPSKSSTDSSSMMRASKKLDERARLETNDEDDMMCGRGSSHGRRGFKKAQTMGASLTSSTKTAASMPSATGPGAVAAPTDSLTSSKKSASMTPATRPGAVAVAAPPMEEDSSKLRLGTFMVRSPSDRAIDDGETREAAITTTTVASAAYMGGTEKARMGSVAMPGHEGDCAMMPGAVATPSVHEDKDDDKKPKSLESRRDSMPGAVSISGFEDEVNNRPYLEQHNNTEMYDTQNDGTPRIVAHLVTEDEETPRKTSLPHIDESLPMAVAKKDSFWSLLRHDRRTKMIAALFLIAIIGLGVGLGVSLSKSNNNNSGFQDVPDETYLQAGSSIDGPDQFFEYGSGEGSKFGSAVAMSGDGMYIAIGAPKFKGTVNGEESVDLGLVHLFHEKDGDWALMEPSVLGEAPGDQTGSAVSFSLDGSTVAISSPGFSNKKGQVKVYRLDSGEAWVLLGMAIIGEQEGDELGTSVSVSENGRKVAVGLKSLGEGSGERAKVFEYDAESGDWMQLGQTLEGHFGGNPISMSADGTTVAMGSLSTAENAFHAAIRVYEYGSSGNWTLRGSEIIQQGAEGSYETGWSVSLAKDGRTVAIGTSVENRQKIEDFDLKVLVYRFDEEETGDWVQQGENLHDKKGDHLIAYRVALSSDAKVLAIGDPGGFAHGIKSGHTHVLRWQNEEWYHITKELEGTDAADLFGEALSLTADGNRVCIGAPQSRATGAEVGRVQIFELANV